jgi:hypothetical protein
MMVKWMKMKETPKKGDRSRRTMKKKEKAQLKIWSKWENTKILSEKERDQ